MPRPGSSAGRLQRLQYFSSLIGPYPYEKLAQVQATAWFRRNGEFERDLLPGVVVSGNAGIRVSAASRNRASMVRRFGYGSPTGIISGSAKDLRRISKRCFMSTRMARDRLKQIMADHAKDLILSKLAHSQPVIDPAQTDLMQKLNPVNYQKGAWILHMLRGMLGDASFFRGIRRYYSLYAGGNASQRGFSEGDGSGQRNFAGCFLQTVAHAARLAGIYACRGVGTRRPAQRK